MSGMPCRGCGARDDNRLKLCAHARRMRKLELLLLRWLALEEDYDRTQTSVQVEKAARAIQNHRAVVRRALFR